MKTILSFAFAIVLSIGISACSSKEEPKNEAGTVECCCTEKGETCAGNCGCGCEGCAI